LCIADEHAAALRENLIAARGDKVSHKIGRSCARSRTSFELRPSESAA
jgi:hypothetical protein